MGTGRTEVMAAPRQGWGQPQRSAVRIGDHLHVHPMAAVLGRVVCAAVAEAVALGQAAVEQDEFRCCLARSAQQTRPLLRVWLFLP